MAGAIITRDVPRGHLRVILSAGAASMLLGVGPGWAQSPWGGNDLPFCPVYPPGHAPAIGPSNCTPVPEALWGPTVPVPDFAVPGVAPVASTSPARLEKPSAPTAVTPVRTEAPTPVAKPVVQTPALLAPTAPAPTVKPPAPPAPQATVALRTPGAITLDQVAAMLGPVSKRTVVFTLSAADEYKKADITHRVTLTWSGPLQALVDQLGAIYGLDVAMDDTAIRFSSRQVERAASAPTTRTSEGRS